MTGSGAPGARFRFSAEVWRWEGKDAWWFLSLPPDASDEIEATAAGARRGFGSVRVEVTIGATTWQTSVFPDKTRQTYVLPVKKEVRRAEGLDAGTVAEVELAVVDPVTTGA